MLEKARERDGETKSFFQFLYLKRKAELKVVPSYGLFKSKDTAARFARRRRKTMPAPSLTKAPHSKTPTSSAEKAEETRMYFPVAACIERCQRSQRRRDVTSAR